jgi:hypothetical protein
MESNGHRHNGLANATMAFVTIYSLVRLVQTFNQAAKESGTTPWKLLKKTLLYMVFGGIAGTTIACSIIAIHDHHFSLNPGIVLLIVAFLGWKWYNGRTVKKQIANSKQI